MEEIDEIEEYCINLRMRGEKESSKMVVVDFCVRGGPILTRYGGMVVRSVVSCLAKMTRVGMNIKCYGSGD